MIEIINADCRSLSLASVRLFDACLTDLPYADHVHTNAVSVSHYTGGQGIRERQFGFDSLSSSLAEYFATVTANVRGWSLSYSDVESAQDLVRLCEAAGAEYLRTLPWVRWSMPQTSADRPPQGLELIPLLHAGGKKEWYGPGNLLALEHQAMRGDSKHPTQKPLSQALDLVYYFTRPGERVLDLCAGFATFGLACRLLGREYVGFEKAPEYYAIAKKRLEAPLNKSDAKQVDRWFDLASERAADIERQLKQKGKHVQAKRAQQALEDASAAVRANR